MQIWGVVFVLLNFISADQRYVTGVTTSSTTENTTVDTTTDSTTNTSDETTISAGAAAAATTKAKIASKRTKGPIISREIFVQLAIPKPVITRCDNTTSAELTNRDIQFTKFGKYETPCKVDKKMAVAPLVIEIRPSDRVGAVVVSSGTNDQKKDQSNLNYFEVKLRPQNSKDLLKCGTFPMPFSPSRRMKVNCKLSSRMITGVVITPRKSIVNASTQLIEISEIGVRSKEYTVGIDAFYGCYKNFVADKKMEKMENESCDDICYNNKYIFASTRSDESCICSDKVPTKALETNNCLPLCGKMFCGGESKFGVYTAMIPQIHLVGCKDVTPEPDLEDSMTPGKCIEECAFQALPFAYLHNMRFCACKSKLIGEEVPMKACHSLCEGQSNAIKSCGGTNASLVYTGYISEKGATSIIDVLRCDTFDESGWCLGDCDTGFKGRLCVERDDTDLPEDKLRSNRSRTRASALVSTNVVSNGTSSKDINTKRSAMMDDASITASATGGDMSSIYFIIQIAGLALLVVIVVAVFIVLISKFGKSEGESSEED